MRQDQQAVFSSKLFTVSNHVLTTHPSITLGMSFAQYYELLKRENGGPFDIVDGRSHGYYINDHGGSGDKRFTNTECVTARVYDFSKFITHGQIWGEGERLGISRCYATGDGLILANDLARQNIPEPGYGIIIYLDGDCGFHRIRVYHCMDGKKGINFYQAQGSGAWSARNGVLYDDLPVEN